MKGKRADGCINYLPFFMVKNMNKFPPWIRWLVIAVIALFILSVVRDFVIKTAIETTSQKVIGAKVHMGSFSLGLLTRQIHIRDFKLYNPPNFPDQIFLSMPEMRVQVDIIQLLQGRMHFPHVVFDMEKLVVVKNKEGKLNTDSLKIIEEQKQASKGKPMKLPVFQIDTLKLDIGKVVMEDYSHGDPTVIEVYEVAIKDKTIKNIDGVPKLVTMVLVEALKPTAIRSAGLMAATTLMGVAFLPAVAIGVAVVEDQAKFQFHQSVARVYEESLKLVKELSGNIKQQDPPKGQILAKVYGCDIVINIQDKGWGKSEITIKARKYMLARLEIANGLLYQLKERLK